MRLYGQEFGAGTVSRIRDAVNADEGLTRSALSRQVCEWLNWRTAQGALREMSCRKALLELEARGKLDLPPSRSRPGEKASAPSDVETQNPVADDLQPDSANPRRVLAPAAIVNLGQREKPPALARILRCLGQATQTRPIKIFP